MDAVMWSLPCSFSSDQTGALDTEQNSRAAASQPERREGDMKHKTTDQMFLTIQESHRLTQLQTKNRKRCRFSPHQFVCVSEDDDWWGGISQWAFCILESCTHANLHVDVSLHRIRPWMLTTNPPSGLTMNINISSPGDDTNCCWKLTYISLVHKIPSQHIKFPFVFFSAFMSSPSSITLIASVLNFSDQGEIILSFPSSALSASPLRLPIKSKPRLTSVWDDPFS